jgi:alcohol dehydrogenase class IV
VGGGSVLDTAKLVCLALANDGVDVLFDGGELRPAVPLVAVPTTAGSGAERTPFAVAYRGSEKHSIGHESLAPIAAVVDPDLTHSAPRDLTVASGLDALAHAMESLWSTRATADSREQSRRALYLAWNTISIVAEDPTRAARSLMAEAATTAGAAIATARTTAAHALSYHLTYHYGVPHGPAVALTLGPLLELNGEVAPDSTMHPGGAAAVRDLVVEIAGLMGAGDGAGGRVALQSRMRDLGAPTRLSDIGLTTEEQVDSLIDSVNQERLANNPRRLNEGDLRRLLGQIR